MRTLLLLLAMIAVGPAHAAECSNPQTQRAMSECAGQDQQRLDAQLNALYGQIQRRLKDDPETAKLMTAAQRSWIGFRDDECTFSSSQVKGGTMYPMIYSICIGRLTRSRIDDFKRYLSCKEGDLDCPVPPR